MPDRPKKGRQPQIPPVLDEKTQGALENLKLALTSPRPRAPGTISSYLCRANQYLTWLNVRIPPSERDFRTYFAERRAAGIGEGSLRTLFAVLKRLYETNGWDWLFTEDDRPLAPSEAYVPAFTEDEVATLIRNRDRYTEAEAFYLASSTTFGMRREELARVTRKDIKLPGFLVHTAKRGPERWHLIPDELMPVITAYKPKAHWPSTISAMFQRIMEKSDLGPMKGYGWHSIRRTLDTLLPIALAQQGLPLTFVAEFLRWSKKTIGRSFLGSPMAGHYTHPEILSSDPYALDRLILPIHPLLAYWRD